MELRGKTWDVTSYMKRGTSKFGIVTGCGIVPFCPISPFPKPWLDLWWCGCVTQRAPGGSWEEPQLITALHLFAAPNNKICLHVWHVKLHHLQCCNLWAEPPALGQPYPGFILPAVAGRAFPALTAFLEDPRVDRKNKFVIVWLIQVCPLSAVRVDRNILHSVGTASVRLPVCHHPSLDFRGGLRDCWCHPITLVLFLVLFTTRKILLYWYFAFPTEI